jgi:NDP-sugar pyrophosphorylase family protein
VTDKGEKNMKKYELTDILLKHKTSFNEGVTTYQIQALIDIPFAGVKAGDMGGYVVDEHRLSQNGNCWIFPDSVATDGTEISGNSLVCGRSFLSSGAIVRGNCIVENSEIGVNTIIEGKVIVRNALLYEGCAIENDVEIIESELCSIHMESGSVMNSTVRANGEPLETKGEVIIKSSVLEIYGGDNFIEKGCWIESVKAEDIRTLQFYESVHMASSEFMGETHLYIGERGEENTCSSIIKGIEGVCTFENVKLTLVNSTLLGSVSVKGSVRLSNSHISECSSIINNTPDLLSLTDVKMKELSCIRKDIGTLDSYIRKTVLTMDNTISC